jgi:hypothetical protein
VGEAIYTQDVPPTLDQGKLNVKFVEYMMGLPAGWVTDLDISRANKLKILGNGVVPQQAYRALELLCNINSYPQGLKTCGQHAQARSSYPQYCNVLDYGSKLSALQASPEGR